MAAAALSVEALCKRVFQAALPTGRGGGGVTGSWSDNEDKDK